jgi:beta-N-acetylhexosaminidase
VTIAGVTRNPAARSLCLALLVTALGLSACGGSASRSHAPNLQPTAAQLPAATPDTASPAVAAPPLLAPPPVVKSYVPFPQHRKDETRAYALKHYGIDDYHLTHPHLVIWHFTETTTYQSVFNTFSDDVPDIEFHELPQVCSHFVVDTDGTIHQLVPLGIICRHVVGLNYTAIGIEMVGTSDQQVIGDTRQFHAALSLTRWLRCRFAIPVHDVIGHNESLQSSYYRERVPAFRGQTHNDFKRADMNIVRAHVATLACRS